jgi:hypothetical protein
MLNWVSLTTFLLSLIASIFFPISILSLLNGWPWYESESEGGHWSVWLGWDRSLVHEMKNDENFKNSDCFEGYCAYCNRTGTMSCRLLAIATVFSSIAFLLSTFSIKANPYSIMPVQFIIIICALISSTTSCTAFNNFDLCAVYVSRREGFDLHRGSASLLAVFGCCAIAGAAVLNIVAYAVPEITLVKKKQ